MHTAQNARTRGAQADDQGIAMIVIVAVVVILFMLASMLIYTTNYMTEVGRRQEIQTKSMHLADAGLNAYLYQLRRDPTYYQAHPTLGPTTQDDGVWSVLALAPTTTAPLTLRAIGHVTSSDSTRTVVATVRFPTFADYSILYDASPAPIASNTVINGSVRTNSTLTNHGLITGKAYAGSSISNDGTIQGGSFPNSPLIAFSQVTADMTSMQAAAASAGSYYAGSGSRGYLVTLSNSSYRVDKVTAVSSTGTFTVTMVVAAAAYPACGVVYCNDSKVYVKGTYGTPVTVCGTTDIWIVGNLGPTVPTSSVTGGLVAQRSILIPTWFVAMPSTLVVQEALLAQSGNIQPETSRSGLKTTLSFLGSMAGSQEGWMYDGSHGFDQRTYTYDQRLNVIPPPRYPVVHDGSLKVNTWIER